jgi:mono/diheme cytochrome c family protein
MMRPGNHDVRRRLGAIVGLGIAIFTLLGAPLLARHPLMTRSPHARTPDEEDAMTSTLTRTWTAFALGALAVAAPAVAQPGRDAEPGRAVFFSQGCYGCHRLGAAGTPIAHDLSHVGRKYTETELARWLRDPASQKPTAHMPRLALTEEEIRALAAYLASLR